MLLTRYTLTLEDAPLFPPSQCLILDNELLAFNSEETSTLYNEILKTPRSSEQITDLLSATGGWVTGLILLRRENAVSGIPLKNQTLAMLDKYFSRFFFSDFKEEQIRELSLLALLPDIPKDFFTSIASATTRKLIDTLLQNNVFIREDRDNDLHIISFHHLLREHLRQQALTCCTQDERREIRLAAGEWCLKNGHTISALENFALASHWRRISILLSSKCQILLAQNKHRSLRRILNMIPQQTIEAFAWLSYCEGVTRQALLQQDADHYILNAVNLFKHSGEEAGELQALGALFYYHIFYAYNSNRQSLLRRAIDLFHRRSNELPPLTGIHISQSLAKIVYYNMADFSESMKYIEYANKISKAEKLPQPYLELQITSSLLQSAHGDTIAASYTLDSLFSVSNSPSVSPFTRFCIKLVQANVLSGSGSISNYIECVNDIKCSHATEMTNTLLGLNLPLRDIEMLFAQGEYAQALTTIDTHLGTPLGVENLHSNSQLRRYRALALAHLDRTDEVLDETRQALVTRAKAGGLYFAVLSLALLGGALSRCPQHHATARRMLDNAVRKAQNTNNPYLLPTAYAYRASLNLAAGKDAEAASDVDAMLTILQTSGNLYFFGCTPLLLSRLLPFAAMRSAHFKTAQQLAHSRLKLHLLQDGSTLPLLHIETVSGVVLRMAKSDATLAERDITPLQSKLLTILAGANDMEISFEQMQQELWPDPHQDADRSKLDTLLSRLRKSLMAAFGRDAAKRYLELKAGSLRLRYCTSDVADAAREASRGLHLAQSGKVWQAHCAFVRMSVALGSAPGEGLCRMDARLPANISYTIINAATEWVAILLDAGRLQMGITVAIQALRIDPINDRLQRTYYNLLTALRRPGEAMAALHAYREYLSDAGFDQTEVSDAIEAVLAH